MKHQIALAAITILVGIAGCGHRECDYVKTTKGDQICQEDVDPEDESEQAKAEEAEWRTSREAPEKP